MFVQKKRFAVGAMLLLVCLFTSSCSLLSGTRGEVDATATPTMLPGGDIGQPEANTCEGLSGTFELQLLVGPSEAVGLEPFTMARIPFTVRTEGEAYLVEGYGQTKFYEDVLEAEWGTFTVRFDGEIRVSGNCVAVEAPGLLTINLEMDGEQMVEVVVEGETFTYPWAGTPTLSASFPIEDGAQQAGDGWVLILHLD